MMMSARSQDLSLGLQAWANRNRISAAALAKSLDYPCRQAQRLLHGDLEVSEATLGRILVRFGPAAAQEVAQFVEPFPTFDTE
jgi:hypothetical protein